jgi:integrase
MHCLRRGRFSFGHFSQRRTVMGISQYDPAAAGRQAWNAGKQVGAKRALKVRQIWSIRFFLDREGRMRDRALLDLAIDSKLRGCDLVKVKIGTLVAGPTIRARSMVIQQKTGRPVQFEITADARTSLSAWLERRGGSVDDFAFPSRVNSAGHLSTRQYARLVAEWVTAIGLRPEEYGTHSLRRTKASIIYKATGNLRAIQILLGHSKIENTVRVSRRRCRRRVVSGRGHGNLGKSGFADDCGAASERRPISVVQVTFAIPQKLSFRSGPQAALEVRLGAH